MRGGDDFLADALGPRSDINRQLGRTVEATTDAARALDLLKKSEEPGKFSSDVGHAYYTLGLALQSQGRRSEAYSAFISAGEYLQAALGPDHPDTVSARRLTDS
jgi:tetratricopeptide (TPR) repeat protein